MVDPIREQERLGGNGVGVGVGVAVGTKGQPTVVLRVLLEQLSGLATLITPQ